MVTSTCPISRCPQWCHVGLPSRIWGSCLVPLLLFLGGFVPLMKVSLAGLPWFMMTPRVCIRCWWRGGGSGGLLPVPWVSRALWGLLVPQIPLFQIQVPCPGCGMGPAVPIGSQGEQQACSCLDSPKSAAGSWCGGSERLQPEGTLQDC